jgi:hypothetical protein
MTIDVSNNNPIIEYSVAEGVTQTVFAVPFDYFEDSDVSIYVDGVKKVLGTDYTMTGGDGSTGTITFVTATPPEVQQVTGATGGSTVMVVREVALERVTDFVAGQDINRAALNTQLDTLTAIAADIDSKINRSLRLPMSSNIVNPLPEGDRANKYIGFNSEGNPVYVEGTDSSFVVSSYVEPLLSSGSSNEFLTGLGFTTTATNLNTYPAFVSYATSSIANLNSGKQNVDATLTALSGTLTAANKIPYATSIDVAGELDFKDEDDMASDSATAVPSQQSVKAYVDTAVAGIESGIGYGQSWQNVTGSRVSGVSYPNSTDKPIMVSAICNAVSGGATISGQVSSDNVTFLTVSFGQGWYGADGVSFIVPPGHWYKVNGSIQSWTELR